MRLADWQGAFMQALQANGDDNALLALVNQREQSRLKVYQNNAFQALLSSLQSSFPVCQTVVGEHCFEQFAQQYCNRYPLCDANLNHYGAQFPRLLGDEVKQHQAFIGLEYLPELAMLEWTLKQGYYAQDRSDFVQLPQVHGLEELARLSEALQQQAVLLLQPDIELLSCHYPVQRVWLKHQATTEQSHTASCDSATNYLLIFRERFKVSFRQISAPQAQLIMAIQQSLSLGQLTNTCVDLSELPQLIQQGWIAGYKLAVTADG